jgi:hypothetical protein
VTLKWAAAYLSSSIKLFFSISTWFKRAGREPGTSGPRGLGLRIRHFGLGLGTPPTPLPLTEAAAAVPVLQRANWIMSRWLSIEWRAGADLQSLGSDF